MEVVHSLTMYLDRRRLVPCVDVMQCDADTRVLELTLMAGGEAWAVPSGMGVAVAFRKSDGTAGLYDVLPDGTRACSYSGNVVRAVLAPQVLTAWGKVEVAVVIQDPDTLDRVATFPVCLEVARDPAAGKGISNDYYRCTSLTDVNEILDGFSQELEEFRDSVRPHEWTVNAARVQTNSWSSFLDLPANRIYRFSYDLPSSFGLPISGKPCTLISLDASSGNAVWGTMYICSAWTADKVDGYYMAYVKAGGSLADVRWAKIALDPDGIWAAIGNLAKLETADKSSMVAAINEVARSGGGAGGQPITVSMAAEMSDTQAKYLYMGSETGWQHGAWYYWNGAKWTVGGEYGEVDVPVKGVDYWTAEEQQAVQDEANAIIAEELAKRGQVEPEFANDVSECTDTTKLYVLPDGQIWAYIKTEISGEDAALGAPDMSVYSTVLSAESSQRYTFSKTAATLSGKLKSVTVKCDVVADVVFAVAHISGVESGVPVVASIDEFTITTKVGENTYVNGTDFTYDGEVREGDLIGYKQATGTVCKVYYGMVSDAAQQWYNTVSHTDYTLSSKTYGYAISAVVETESVTGYAWADTGHAFVPADYEDRIVALEKETAEQGTVVQALSEDVSALKEDGAKAASVVIGTEIDPGVADYSDSEAFVIKVKPSALTGTLTMEKSEDTNTSAVRQVCYVDFSGGKIGFYGRCADGATLTVYKEQILGFDLVAGHEYVAEMIKQDNKYAILRVTDAYSLESDEIYCSEYNVGRGWGARKYSYTGDAADIVSVKSYVLQNKKTKLMIVGDSYIEGSSLPENGEDRDGRYAMLMKKALGGDCFINGRGGAASADILGWFNGYLPEVCQPEYVILSCGTNDSRYDNWVARMQSIIAKIQEMGATPILTTIAALAVGNCKDIWPQQNAWIRSSGYDYIDINLVTSLDYGMESIDPELFYGDAVHPNAAGHARIFKRARLDVPYLFV